MFSFIPDILNPLDYGDAVSAHLSCSSLGTAGQRNISIFKQLFYFIIPASQLQPSGAFFRMVLFHLTVRTISHTVLCPAPGSLFLRMILHIGLK